MVRIETTAELDAEGRFSASGQAPQSVPPGVHRVIIFVDDQPVSADSTARDAGEHRSCLIERDGAFLLDAEPLPGAEMDIVAMIESVRRERDEHILGRPLP